MTTLESQSLQGLWDAVDGILGRAPLAGVLAHKLGPLAAHRLRLPLRRRASLGSGNRAARRSADRNNTNLAAAFGRPAKNEFENEKRRHVRRTRRAKWFLQ